MFDKNDRTLLTVRTLMNVFTIIFVIFCAIAGIVLAACGMLAAGLTILFCGPLFFWLVWLVIRLHLTYLCDIKLIRNKLYGIENSALNAFIKESAQPAPEEEQNAFTYQQLEKLNYNGIISNEEFEWRTRMFLQKEAENLHEENEATVSKANDPADDLKAYTSLDSLYHLKKLLDRGKITQAQYDTAKARIMKNINFTDASDEEN